MSRDRFTPSRYHLMSAAEKRAASIGGMRERAVSCPRCDMQVMPADLLGHLSERCAGPNEPGPGAKWVTWREALSLGVRPKTLSNWARSGQVRYVGGRLDRRYLHRDLALKIAQRRGIPRR